MPKKLLKQGQGLKMSDYHWIALLLIMIVGAVVLLMGTSLMNAFNNVPLNVTKCCS